MVSSRGLSAPAGAGAETSTDGSDVFAALLGAAGVQANASGKTSAPVSLASDVLAGLTLDAEGDGTDQQAPENPDAIAAAINAVLPLDAVAPAAEAKPLLQDVLASLADLRQKLDSGAPLAPEFLAELDAQLDALGDSLGIDLASMPTLADLAALAAEPVPEGAGLATRLAGSLASLADQLLETQANAPAGTAALQKTVGEKLAALLGSIDQGDLGAGKLAELGLSSDAELDADIEATIAKLLPPPLKLDTGLAGTVLAKPALQLSEPVLTGKAGTEPALAVDATADPSLATQVSPSGKQASDQQGNAGAGGERDPEGKSADTPPADSKPAPTMAGANDKGGDPQAPVPTQQQARVDAVAAPRVVQTGYQTSQQQLNLPQIAFELARQTSEGNTRFQIRLDPAELGRIDVQLDIDNTGQVNARLFVEKAETLDLMQRDQRGLEKALHQAGLDSAKTNLEFSLKQNNGGDAHQHGRNHQGRGSSAANRPGELAEAPPTINLYRASLSASGVNIIA